MKYIDLINSFWDLAGTNPFSAGQTSLYFALLHVCNRSYWSEWFQASNQVLSILTGLSRSGIQKARTELKQRGILEFKEQGTKTTIYKIIPIKNNQTDVLVSNSGQESNQTDVLVSNSNQVSGQDGGQESVQTDVLVSNSGQDGGQESNQTDVPMEKSNQVGNQDGGQIGGKAIYSININNIHSKDKRLKTKDNKTEDIPPISPIKQFEDFWSVYPNKQRRILTEQAYCQLVISGTVTEEQLMRSAKNYAKYIQETGTTNKVYLPNNFLEKCIFEDFLPRKKKTEQENPAALETLENQEAAPEDEVIGDDWMEYEQGRG